LAEEAVNDETTLEDKIWQFRDCKHCDLGIRPILMDSDNKKHDTQLFDRNCLEGEEQFIKEGYLYNSSK
jgi:hypothetical protein